jgi:hypothetical protein
MSETAMSPHDGAYPDTWSPADLEATIAGLLDLRDGWDSYRGQALTAEARVLLPRAIQVAHAFGLPRPWVVPCSDGGFQLEWHRPDFEAEVELDSDGDVTLFIDQPGPDAEAKLVETLRILSKGWR